MLRLYVRTYFPLPCVYVCVFVSQEKKKVIIPHCLRECIVCNITCPPSFKSYHGF